MLKNKAPTSNKRRVYKRRSTSIHFGRVEDLYSVWPTPTCIISDGPYGLSGFPGDLPTPDGLAQWYRPHIEAWSQYATPETTLWFWNSEVGWATVHPILVEHGWEYRCCHFWDKGLGHVAGNTNTRTLRKFPVTTEVCVQYVKQARVGSMTLQEWLRHEWTRSGLPLRVANAACGVANAATRKYLTADHLWYFPPPEAFAQMAVYANTHGNKSGRPYFSVDGIRPINSDEWIKYRAKFNCLFGVTNAWRHPQVGGRERINGQRSSMKWKYNSLHGSQKPLALVEIAVKASTEPNDVVWEPFGGLCPAAVCSLNLDRVGHSAEIVTEFYDAAVERLSNA